MDVYMAQYVNIQEGRLYQMLAKKDNQIKELKEQMEKEKEKRQLKLIQT